MRSDKHKDRSNFAEFEKRRKEIEEFNKSNGKESNMKSDDFDLKSANDGGKSVEKKSTAQTSKDADERERYKNIVKAENKKKKNDGGGKPPKDKKNVMLGKDGLPKKKKSKKKTILIIIICLLILIGCVVSAGLLYFNNLTGKLDIVKIDPAEFDIDTQVAKDLENYRDVAILGVDARKNESYKGSRSDAIIIARINNKTGEIQLISVMRDSYLQIEGEDGSKSIDKITHAHAYGGGLDTCKSLNRNLDLNIEEFIVFNWQAVADTVDSVGGVTVTIDSNEISDMNQYGYESAENVDGTYTPIYNTGKQKLDGAQAVTYCRIRKNSGGDTGRGNRYKEVMNALMNKSKNMSVTDLNNLASKIFPEIQTNMTKSSMLKSLTKIGTYKFGKNYEWPKKYYGGLINGVWYAVPKNLENNVKWLHKKAFDQTDYQVSDTCKDISDQISENSGVYAGD